MNKRGYLVQSRLDWARGVMGDEVDAEWANEGDRLSLQLRSAMHGDVDIHSIGGLEPEVRRWQKFGIAMEHVVVGTGGPSVRSWVRDHP